MDSRYKIFRFELPLQDEAIIQMPEEAKILSVEAWKGISIWAECFETHQLVPRVFRISGTGHPVPDGKFVGTVITPPFVWHVYDGGER